MSEPRITFLASFPAIQSAIKVGDTGMRIVLDIPETEMGNAVALIAMRQKRLRVIVEEDSGERVKTTRRRTAKRRE